MEKGFPVDMCFRGWNKIQKKEHISTQKQKKVKRRSLEECLYFTKKYNKTRDIVCVCVVCIAPLHIMGMDFFFVIKSMSFFYILIKKKTILFPGHPTKIIDIFFSHAK